MLTFFAAAAFTVRLIEPAGTRELEAGSHSFISWQAENVPDNVDEWEAFLSADGGRTYPVRVTPHLDASIHRFRWSVPAAPTRTLTIMLRFGDERHEQRFVFPLATHIAGAAPHDLPRPVEVEKRGESATEDGEGAGAWVEGNRDGTLLREVVTAEREKVAASSAITLTSTIGDAFLPRLRVTPVEVRGPAWRAPRNRQHQRTAPIFSVADILLTTRLNV